VEARRRAGWREGRVFPPWEGDGWWGCCCHFSGGWIEGIDGVCLLAALGRYDSVLGCLGKATGAEAFVSTTHEIGVNLLLPDRSVVFASCVCAEQR
jgi:hypothetical protein